MGKIDVICPIFYVDLDSFEGILDTWFQNIPIRKLYIGLGKENNELVEFLSKNPKVHTTNQTDFKTLGYCLQDLIKNFVETEFFIFFHADVGISPNWFERMWGSRVKGILESLKAPSFGAGALIQASKFRAYSGAQLILRESVENLNFEDDFIYTNEDIIIQNIVLNRGFSYVKTPIYHTHHIGYKKRTQTRRIILDWQWRGIIKYSYPNSNLMNHVKGIIKLILRDYEIEIDLEKEVKSLNPNWISYL